MPTFAKPIAGASLYSLVLLLGNLALVLTPGITEAEGLKEGTWNGTYDNYLARYEITNSTEGEKTRPKIEIYFPDLKEFFKTKDVEVIGKKLSFTIDEIGGEDCTLEKQENGQYIGVCKSLIDEADNSNSFEIYMVPPVAVENENSEPMAPPEINSTLE